MRIRTCQISVEVAPGHWELFSIVPGQPDSVASPIYRKTNNGPGPAYIRLPLHAQARAASFEELHPDARAPEVREQVAADQATAAQARGPHPADHCPNAAEDISPICCCPICGDRIELGAGIPVVPDDPTDRTQRRKRAGALDEPAQPSAAERASAQLIVQLIGGMIETVRLALVKSASAAVDHLAEAIEEPGVEDPKTRDILDRWWAKRKRPRPGGGS